MSLFKTFLLFGSLFVLGCWSGEKIIKPLGVVAKFNQGDFEVEEFLINGKPADEFSSATPNQELKVNLTFKRNKESQAPQEIWGSIVAIMYETEFVAKGSHTIMSQVKTPTDSAKGTKTIEMKLFAPKAESHNLIANHTQGMQLVIAENGSEIVSKRIDFIAEK